VAVQIALQMFWLLSFVPEPLSMAAQSLIARDSTDSLRVRKMTWLLVHIASFMSIVLAGIVAGGFYYGAKMFSPDPDIVDGVRSLVLPVRTLPATCVDSRHLLVQCVCRPVLRV
jgi:hypothetical protein